MDKKNLAFAVAVSSDLLFAAANVALACNQYVRVKDYDIILYYDKLDPSALSAASKIPHCIPKQIRFPDGFVENMLQRLPIYSRFASESALMAFCKFEAFSLLETYKTVVWLDVDINIQANMDELIRHKPLAIIDDGGLLVQINFVKPIPGYIMSKPGYRTSLIVMQDTLPYEDMYTWCWEKSLEYAHCLFNQDQGILNLLLQKFSIEPITLSLNKWSCPPNRPAAKSASIVHFGGSDKIWMNPNLRSTFPEWQKRHLAWLELGGTDYPSVPATALASETEWECDPSERFKFIDAKFAKFQANMRTLREDTASLMASELTYIQANMRTFRADSAWLHARLDELLRQNNVCKTTLCFGTGSMAENIIPALRQEYMEIKAFIDERSFMRGATYSDRPVIDFEQITSYSFDYILVACRPAEHIITRLLELGIPAETIVSLDVENLLWQQDTQDDVSLCAVLCEYLRSFPGLIQAIDVPVLLDSPWLRGVRAWKKQGGKPERQ